MTDPGPCGFDMSEKADELVERLKDACHGDWATSLAHIPRALFDAANEITSLRAQLAAAEAKLLEAKGWDTARDLLEKRARDHYETKLASARKALETLEAEAGRYAEMYPHGSDGRNTFIIFREKIRSLDSTGGEK